MERQGEWAFDQIGVLGRDSFQAGSTSRKEAAVKSLSILQWYHVLRMHYHWTVFEAVRFALWLAR